MVLASQCKNSHKSKPKVRILFIACDDDRYGPIEHLKRALEDVGEMSPTIDVSHTQKEAIKVMKRVVYSHLLFTVVPGQYQEALNTVKHMRKVGVTRPMPPIVALMDDVTRFTGIMGDGFEDVLDRALPMRGCCEFVTRWVKPFIFPLSTPLSHTQQARMYSDSGNVLTSGVCHSSSSLTRPPPWCDCCKTPMRQIRRPNYEGKVSSTVSSHEEKAFELDQIVNFGNGSVINRPILHCCRILLHDGNPDPQGDKILAVHAIDQRFTDEYGFKMGQLKFFEELLFEGSKEKRKEISKIHNGLAIGDHSKPLPSGYKPEHSGFMWVSRAENKPWASFVSIRMLNVTTGDHDQKIGRRFYIATVTPASLRDMCTKVSNFKRLKQWSNDSADSTKNIQNPLSSRLEVTRKHYPKEALEDNSAKEGYTHDIPGDDHDEECPWGKVIDDILKLPVSKKIIDEFVPASSCANEDNAQDMGDAQVNRAANAILNTDVVTGAQKYANHMTGMELPSKNAAIFSTPTEAKVPSASVKGTTTSLDFSHPLRNTKENSSTSSLDYAHLFDDGIPDCYDEVPVLHDTEFKGPSLWI